MFFPEDDIQVKRSDPVKVVYIFENDCPQQKAFQFKITKKKSAFKDLMKELSFNQLRLFNSEGAEYFEDDLEYVKNKTVLYASKGEDFNPSSCFGEYEMIKKLGEGGFGEVLLAKHKQTAQMFAIKIIKTDKIGTASDIDNIFVQAQVLKSLKHDNIVKVHNCLTLKNMKVAIIMEYLEGGELLHFVEKQERLDEETAKVFIKQIAKAMNYCHINGLIHRDLKLENMLLVNSQEKKIKIIDFGIAGVIQSLTWQDLDIGSLGYMAPQCFISSKNLKIDGRIDVWATGVILFAMLTGQLPFKGGNNLQVIELIKEGKFKIKEKIRKNLSEECLDVIHKCLDTNSRTRLTMEQLLDHPWISKNLFMRDMPEKQKEEVVEVQKKEAKQNEKKVMKKRQNK